MDFLIFVTLGTQDKPFPRLLQAIEQLINNNIITDEVIVQAGFTKFKSNKMQIFDLIPQEDFLTYIKQSNLVITHGGVGSIISALNMDKKIIAAPRLSKYGEHVNDHQLQIIKCFAQKKYILPLYDFNNLESVIANVKNFTPCKFESNRDNFLKVIEKLISQ